MSTAASASSPVNQIMHATVAEMGLGHTPFGRNDDQGQVNRFSLPIHQRSCHQVLIDRLRLKFLIVQSARKLSFLTLGFHFANAMNRPIAQVDVATQKQPHQRPDKSHPGSHVVKADPTLSSELHHCKEQSQDVCHRFLSCSGSCQFHFDTRKQCQMPWISFMLN